MRQINPRIELASGEYDLCKVEVKGKSRVTVRLIEKRLSLRDGQLRNYRANYLSRKARP